MKLLFFVALLPLLFSGFALAKGKQAQPVIINFFLQSSTEDGGKFSFPWQTSAGKLHFKKGAEFKTDQIIGHRPFPSPHSEHEYGMVFQLNTRASDHLRTITADTRNHGKYLIVFMNNKSLDMLRIDKRVDDGVICVWRGLQPSDVHRADKLVPRIGEDKKEWKQRRKEEIKAAKR